jgi:hypothetical protein
MILILNLISIVKYDKFNMIIIITILNWENQKIIIKK